MMITITRIVEFDAGHRVPNHKSKCRNAHGHRYRLEATFIGVLNSVAGSSDEGMVADFGDLKEIMLEAIGEPWDHAFLVYEADGAMRDALNHLANNKTVVLPFVPTAENLVQHAFKLLAEMLSIRMPASGISLYKLKLYETPNAWAECWG